MNPQCHVCLFYSDSSQTQNMLPEWSGFVPTVTQLMHQRRSTAL